MNVELPFHIDLTGKTVVITGAGGIMCSYFSKAIALTGANVAMLDINYEAVSKFADEVRSDGMTAIAYKANVLSLEDLESVHNEILKDFGPCDILINGAGGNNPRGNTEDEYYIPSYNNEAVKTFFDLDLDGFRFVMDLNFFGTLIPTRVFSKDMLNKENCSIINISSMNAIKPLTKLPAYSAAKAAVSNLTQWLATYFSKTGIRVNALAPGFFITNQNRPNLIDADGNYTPRAHKILAGTPAGRFGDISELVGALLFLLCPAASSFINGIIIPIDGGFDAYCGV